MDALIILFLLASIILFIAGLIRPTWGFFGWSGAKRWKMLLTHFPVFLFCFGYIVSDSVEKTEKYETEVEALIADGKVSEAEDLLHLQEAHLSDYKEMFEEVYGSRWFIKKKIAGLNDNQIESINIEESKPEIISKYPELNRVLLKKISDSLDHRDKYIAEVEKRESFLRRKKAAAELFEHGQCFELNYYIKQQMHDPSSFEHIQTNYSLKDSYISAATQVRGKNKFGALIKVIYHAKVSYQGDVLSVEQAN